MLYLLDKVLWLRLMYIFVFRLKKWCWIFENASLNLDGRMWVNVQIAMANKMIIPSTASVKFPTLEVNYSDGSSTKLPITSDGDNASASKSDTLKASLVCLSFRASSQVKFTDNSCLSCFSLGIFDNIYPPFIFVFMGSDVSVWSTHR